MGLIHHQVCPVFFADLGHPRQINHVAVHREDRVGDDQLGYIGGNLFQPVFQVFHIVVFESPEFCAGHQASVHDGSVVQFIGQYIIAASHQCGDDRQVGDISRSERYCGFRMFEVCDGLFEFFVNGQRTGQRSDAVRAGANLSIACGRLR